MVCNLNVTLVCMIQETFAMVFQVMAAMQHHLIYYIEVMKVTASSCNLWMTDKWAFYSLG